MSFRDYSVLQLRSIVIYNLDNDLIPSAEFAAERLLAEAGHDDLDSVHLYGLVLLKKKRYKAAYNLTVNISHAGCSYVFAKAALELSMGEEGVFALTTTQHLWDSLPDNFSFQYENERNLLPDPAVFYSLLGKLYYSIGDPKESAICHSKALKKNPFIWESFEELNKIGANIRVKAIYKVQQGIKFPLNHGNSNKSNGESTRDPFGDSATNIYHPPSHKSFIKYTEEFPLHEENNEFQTPRMRQPTLPAAPTRKTRSATAREAFKQPSLAHNSVNNSNGGDSIRRQPRLTASKVTSRLISHPLSAKTANSNTSNRKVPVNDLASQKRSKSFFSGLSGDPTATKRKEFFTNEEYGEQHVLGLYLTYAKGFKAMSRYDCFKAIRTLSSLPEAHLNTPWVLSKMGRLHFEIVNYEESDVYFQKLRKVDKTRLEDMEYYAALLWQTQKEIELCDLSHDLLNIDRHAPQTWVTIGNLFSLSHETDEAIKCFDRATQLDENFTYAYTLQGHEYMTSDAYENALKSFRYALLIDPRHYNALFGIGMVYLKLGNFTKAEYHFRKALDINPVNAILICCVGMMLEKFNKKEEALKQYELGFKIQPLAPLSLFKKAQLLIQLERYSQALTDFEQLARMTPDEATVHFLLGQLYKMHGRKDDAIAQFTIALNLDPKGSHLIKEAMENLNE